MASVSLPTFELSGGALCLDFANTWGDRGRPETDDLGSYAHLLAFAWQTAELPAADLEALALRAQGDAPGAAEALARARACREDLFGLFATRAQGRPLPPESFVTLNAALAEALGHQRLAPVEQGCAWVWEGAAEDLTSPLWPILRSAADLLTSEELASVRECAGARCTWLFLDHSRTRSRRWCSMASCGNRAKALRHYRRRKAS